MVFCTFELIFNTSCIMKHYTSATCRNRTPLLRILYQTKCISSWYLHTFEKFSRHDFPTTTIHHCYYYILYAHRIIINLHPQVSFIIYNYFYLSFLTFIFTLTIISNFKLTPTLENKSNTTKAFKYSVNIKRVSWYHSLI